MGKLDEETKQLIAEIFRLYLTGDKEVLSVKDTGKLLGDIIEMGG